MKKKLLIAVATVAISSVLSAILWGPVGSSGNLDWVKQRAVAKWEMQGFSVIDYEGYKWGFGGFGTPYGGAQVWYRLRHSTTGAIYSGYLLRWGDEVHVYGPDYFSKLSP